MRVAGDGAWLNIKAGGLVASRQEYEYSIPVDEARELLALAVGPLIDKTRHFVEHRGMTWDVDEFHGANEGLVVAELELESEGQVQPSADATAAPTLGRPEPLFVTNTGPVVPAVARQWYVLSPDGQRFLMSVVDATSASPLEVILNFDPEVPR